MTKMEKTKLKRTTLHEQIKDVLRKEIFTGMFKPGENLPPERELAERFGTSRMTMRKALASLAQEGWVDIVQGRGNTVRDFTRSVGIEVLPQLLLSCPEAVLKADILETMIEFSVWLYTQIDLAAAKKASPNDKEILLKILVDQKEGVSVSEYWENDFRFNEELLKIGGNILLQMYFNSQKQFILKALELGMVKDIPYPLSFYTEVNVSLVQAICANDLPKVRQIMASIGNEMAKALRRFIRQVTIADQGPGAG